MPISRYNRAAARRHYKLGRSARKSDKELYAGISSKLRISPKTAYRIVNNDYGYHDDLCEDEDILKSSGHVGWDMDDLDSEKEKGKGSYNEDPLFRKRGMALMSRCDRAVIRRRFKKEYTGSKPMILYQKIGRSYGVNWSTISKVIRNEGYRDNLDEDEMCLRKYDEMQTRAGQMEANGVTGGYTDGRVGSSSSAVVRGRAWMESVEIPVVAANRSVRRNPRESPHRTGNSQAHPEPADSPRHPSSARCRIPSRTQLTPIPVPHRSRPLTRSQNRLPPLTNGNNDLEPVNSNLSHNQPPNPDVESFLTCLNLDHLIPIFHQEGFSNPEILSKLRLSPVDMQHKVLEDFRNEYGLKFGLADKFVLDLELRGYGSLE